MLMPQELRKYEFTRAIRGYSAAEVDEYIDFLCEKYEELYRENHELERKLIAALRVVDESRRASADDAAEKADTERTSARLLMEAERKKKRIIADAEEYADRIIADADARVTALRRTLSDMRESVLAFRDELYTGYSRQIDQIEALAALAEQTSSEQAEPEQTEPVETELVETEPGQAAPVETVPPAAEESEPLAPEWAEAEVPENDPVETAQPEEDDADADDDVILFRMEPDEEEADDAPYIDEEELAATDEALGFFEEPDEPDESDEPEESEESEESGEIDAGETPDTGEYAEASTDLDALITAALNRTETATIGANTDDEDEDGDVVFEEIDAVDASAEADNDAEMDAFDESDESDAVEELDIARAMEALEEFEGVEESDASDEVDDTAGGDTADEADESEADDDETLLRELRQAFQVQFETFEDHGAHDAGDADDADFSFLPETDDVEEEPHGLFRRTHEKHAKNRKHPTDAGDQ